MMEGVNNIGHALVLVACLYFGYANGFSGGLLLLMVFIVATWGYSGFSDERKEYWKAITRYWNAKADWYEKRKER
jgi:uncharacterized membrane protein required for colicin V production